MLNNRGAAFACGEVRRLFEWIVMKRAIRWLTVAHFANDFFPGILGILLAAQSDALGLSKTQIGIASGTFLLVSLSQPFLGWIADRTGKPYIMMSGPLWTSFGMLICGLAGSFMVIMVGVLVGGFGNAMFHPVALASARAFGGSAAKGRSVALFMLGGNGGFAVGPFLAGFLLEAMGPPGVAPFVVINMVVVPWLVWRLYPNMNAPMSAIENEATSRPTTPDHDMPRRWYQTATALLIVYMMIMLVRGLFNQALSVYMPTYYAESGYALDFAGVATAVLLGSAAVGSFLGAWLSDHYSRVFIASFSLLMTTPLSLLLLQASSVPSILIFSVLTGLMLNANWPILLMIGQEVFPGGASGSSGLAFGWGFICNASGSYVTGFLADAIGLQEALQFLALTPLIGAVLLLLLRQPGTKTANKSDASHRPRHRGRWGRSILPRHK